MLTIWRLPEFPRHKNVQIFALALGLDVDDEESIVEHVDFADAINDTCNNNLRSNLEETEDRVNSNFGVDLFQPESTPKF